MHIHNFNTHEDVCLSKYKYFPFSFPYLQLCVFLVFLCALGFLWDLLDVASIKTRLCGGRPRNRGSVPYRDNRFFSSRNRPDWFGAHPAFCTEGTEGCFPGTKQPVCEANQLPELMSGALPPLFYGFHGRYRGCFACWSTSHWDLCFRIPTVNTAYGFPV